MRSMLARLTSLHLEMLTNREIGKGLKMGLFAIFFVRLL